MQPSFWRAQAQSVTVTLRHRMPVTDKKDCGWRNNFAQNVTQSCVRLVDPLIHDRQRFMNLQRLLE